MNALVKTDQTTAAAASEEGEEQQYLTFMLREDIFAIGILSIKEIIEYGKLTEVPRMPAFIRGVINLRGAVVPVVDLASRFGKDSTEIGRRTCIVIIEVANGEETQVIGVMVDAVNAVLEIPQSEIEAAPSFGARIRADFIQGMGKIEENFVIILNVDKVLSVDELEVASRAAEPGLSVSKGVKDEGIQ